MKEFLRIVCDDDPNLQRVQDNIDQFVKPLKNIPILDGILLEGIEVSTSGSNFPHKLNRKLRGWIVVSKNANEDVWDLQTSNTLPSKTLILKSSGTVTISLWVF